MSNYAIGRWSYLSKESEEATSWRFPCRQEGCKVTVLVQMAASIRKSESVHTEKSNLRQKLESSFPLDALLPELHVKNVLTDYEFTQLLPTPQSTLVDRNRKFLDYLANKGPLGVIDTLSVLFRHHYEAYGYFGEMLCDVFGAEGKEGEGMRGKTSRKPQQGGERGSGAKEVSTLRSSHSYAFGWYKVEWAVCGWTS